MKKLLLVVMVLCTTSLFAQREWGNLEKNELTMRELAPIWPGCEDGNASQRDACFKKKLATHIAKNFKYPSEEYKKNIQGRVVITFFINEAGLVDIKSVTGGNENLQAEAKRNIASIPKMAKPGMMGGKPRAIKYTVPITFSTGK
ncbi:MAG: energy transducer TonB [Flavobacteriaceae bacterium]|mgnify:CR=1 FL=1|nr:energy transducer TonB [Flavobacteriaceae bacterium]|tara:strand:+ start:19402 stop:19836 length:435 start_codon:yes stop_codon:yes gene_type:complete